MASAAEANYFPPLDRCLAGRDRLISWKTAYRALCNSDTAQEQSSLHGFLSSNEAIAILSSPLAPWTSPHEGSKSAFETKTAPINVSQSANGDYDLKQIKEDAQWLATQLKIEELVALRAAILEWQQRPAEELLVSAMASGEATGRTSDLKTSFSVSATSLMASRRKAAQPDTNVSDDSDRRDSLLRVFHEERTYVLKISADLVSRHATHLVTGDRSTASWIDELAEKIHDAQIQRFASKEDPSASDGIEKSSQECITWVERMLSRLEDPGRWPEAAKANPFRESIFRGTALINMTDVLRLLLCKIQVAGSLLGKNTILAWFRFMGGNTQEDPNDKGRRFLNDVHKLVGLPDASSLQCMVSIVSLAMLQLPKVAALMRSVVAVASDDSDVAYPASSAPTYIEDNECIKELNIILYHAAQEQNMVASPAIFAWSKITMDIRDIATFESQRRDRSMIDESSSDNEQQRPSAREGPVIRESKLETQYSALQSFELDVDRHDPPVFFARAALDALNVYGLIPELSTTLTATYGPASDTALLARDALLRLLRDSSDLVGYGAEIIEALLGVLMPDETGAKDTSLLHLALQVADDEIFQTSILHQAMVRYPYELSPLLRLSTALAAVPSETIPGTTAMTQMLDTAFRTFTLELPHGFRSYVLENEDENSNTIVLTENLPLFTSKQASYDHGQRLLGYSSGGGSIANGESHRYGHAKRINAGTPGLVMKEERPMIIKFTHHHSALEYLGLLLSTLLPGSDLVPALPCEELDRHGAADIIRLQNALLAASLDQGQDSGEARDLLVRFGSALDNEQDIVTVIADILEMELLAHMDQAAQDGSSELLVTCIQFFALVTNVWADRVWSILARSSLLGVNGGANAIAAVVGGSEVQSGDFRVLTSCCELLYPALVRDAISGLIRRKPRTLAANGSGSRFETPIQQHNTTPDRTLSIVLTAYQRVVLDVFQNLGSWRFTNTEDKQRIVIALSNAFDNILRVTYGLDRPAEEGSAAITNDRLTQKKESLSLTLLPAADMILQAFAPTSGTTSLIPILTALFNDGLVVTGNVTPFQQNLTIKQTTITCTFTSRLMQITRHTESPRAVTLATALVKAMPIYAMLLASEHSYKGPVSSMLSQLVHSLSSQNLDPPSLLAGLNIQAAKSFLSTISQLDKPLCDVEAECHMWDFLTVILQGRQHWFAMYILAGTFPKTRLKNNAIQPKDKTLLVYALDELSKIAVLNPVRAKAMLHFVAVAQSVWVWATSEVRSHPEFVNNTLDWLNDLQYPPSRGADTSQALLSANEHQMAAYMCDILAVNLSAGLEVEDKTLLKALVPKMDFLKKHAATVNAYNRSLHKNLADNLARRFPQMELASFRRTATNTVPYGREYCYDLQLANTMLGHEIAWVGAADRNDQGYSAEVARANINLSLVDAQMSLLRSWKTLASTLSDCLTYDNALPAALATAVERSLRASTDTRVDEPGAAVTLQIRAELSFVLLSKLVDSKVKHETMKTLLLAAWDLVRSSPVDYGVATAPEDLTYYRTLLQILYLAIQPHCYIGLSPSSASTKERQHAGPGTQHSSLPLSTAAILVEIVSITIAPAFRALCGNLHTDLRLALPADFALITALLQAVLAVKGVNTASARITEVVANSNIVRGALSLYTWADQLAEIMDQEPVYGEIAITFLVTLSKIPQIAEQMAVSGILVQLTSANLSNYLRKPGGKGPFDEPRRMFVIWTEGFLPLCLNLLETVGSPMTGEVVAFLNSFPEQLRRAEQAFKTEVPSYGHQSHGGEITLGLMIEAHNLIIIGLILQSDMARGAADGIDAAGMPSFAYDLTNAKSEIEKLARTTRSLADKVVPCNEREVDLAVRSTTAPYDSKLMELVMKEVKDSLEILGE